MSAKPANPNPQGGTEVENLIAQREIVDATELIAQIGHCQWDYKSKRLISCSLGYARIYNMSVAEVIELQSNWERSLERIYPEDRDHYLDAYYSQQESGNYRVEYRILRKGGELRWLSEVGTLKFDDEQNVSEAFCIIQDITDRLNRERELLDSQELARQVEAITDIGHFINDEENDIFLYISPGYARIHGLTVEGFMHFVESQQDNLAAVHEDDREILRAEIIEYMKNGDDNFESEYRIRRPDGDIVWIRERSKARRKVDGQVTETLGVLQDITEKKNFEQSLQDAKDMLEITVVERTQQLAKTVDQLQAEIAEREIVSSELENKNAELERFAYTVSHDLKAPLVTIKGFLGLLGKDIKAKDMQSTDKDLEKLNHAADTMARLLEELLELSRIGRVVGELVACDLSAIAQQAVDLVAARILDNKIEIRIDAMPTLRVDQIRLTEVYQNLIENAVKFIGDQTSSPRIHIGVCEVDGESQYFVDDNGIGIAAKYHERVFGLFERLDTSVDGTGVGLALVKRIIDVHGGRIWVESDGPGHGSRFVFTLASTGQTEEKLSG